MQSSWEGYNYGGFNNSWDPTTWSAQLSEGSPGQIQSFYDSLSVSGIFNMVQCPFDQSIAMPLEDDSSCGPATDIDGFNQILAAPGSHNANWCYSQYMPHCYCMNITDANGMQFYEALDWSMWDSNELDCSPAPQGGR